MLALTVFAASPVLHNWLHSHDGQVGDDGCAVAMFAGGVSVPQGSVALTPPSTAWREIPRVVAVEISLVSPRYLRQPERGPPVG